MSLSVLDSILLLGAVQGILLAFFIFQKHTHLFANRFLGFLTLLNAFILLDLLLSELGYYHKHPWLMLLLAGLPFGALPLYYLYARYLVGNRTGFKKIQWLHFVPLVVFKIYLVLEYLRLDEYLPLSARDIVIEGLPLKFLMINWTITVQGFIYLLLTIALLAKYTRKLKEVFSSIEKIKLNWLRNITYMTFFVLVIFFIENIFLLEGKNLPNFFDLTSLLAAILVYTMGYLGLANSQVFSEAQVAKSLQGLSNLNSNRQVDYNRNPPEVSGKYEKSGLSPEKAQSYLVELLNIMNVEKPYTNSELTLNQLADYLAISPHNLYEVINTQLHQNFFDFINHYRVEEVKRLLAIPQNRYLKIPYLAYQAGFNSKTSFNTIFKKHIGMTALEYRRQLFSGTLDAENPFR